MRIEIEIPKEFENDYNKDKFKDFFSRVLCDIKGGVLCGNYERETAEMFVAAFKESKVIKVAQQNQNALDYETATEILQNFTFGDDHSWLGAAAFVADAFNRDMDEVIVDLEEIHQRSRVDE